MTSSMKKRIEIIERLAGKPGRLLIVEADSDDDADFQIVVEDVERRLTDHILRIPCHAGSHPRVSIYPAGLSHLLDSIDGNSKPLVKEPA